MPRTLCSFRGWHAWGWDKGGVMRGGGIEMAGLRQVIVTAVSLAQRPFLQQTVSVTPQQQASAVALY